MPVSIQESSVHDAAMAVAAAAALVIGARALAVSASVVLGRIGWLASGAGLALELIVVAVCFLVFCADSGLTLPVLISSLAVSLVIGWSLRSVRSLFTAVLLLTSVAGVPLLARHVVVVEDARTTGLWVSAFKEERALLSAVSGPCEKAVSRRVFVYYDGVRLTEDDQLPQTACGDICPPAVPTPLENDENATFILDTEKNEHLRNARQILARPRLLQRIISIGERTQLVGLNSVRRSQDDHGVRAKNAHSHWDAVALLGEKSELRNSLLRCRFGRLNEDRTLSAGDGMAPVGVAETDEPCLIASARIRLHNVTLHVYDPRRGSDPAVLFLQREESCAAARHRLAEQLGDRSVAAALIRCSEKSSSASSVAERFAELLFDTSTGSYLLDANTFLANMPTLVACRWYLPDMFRAMQATLVYVTDTLCAPAGAVVVLLAQTLMQAFTALGAWLTVQMRAAAPFVVIGVRQTCDGALGLVCGGEEDVWLPLCQSRRQQPAYGVGAQVHDSVVTAVLAAVDALDVVPGGWSVLQWGWNTEWHITVGIVRAAYRWGKALGAAMVPLGHAAAAAGEGVVRAAPHCLGPLRSTARLVARSSAGSSVQAGIVWLYTEEVAEMQWEVAAVRHVAAAMWRSVVFTLVALWHAVKYAVVVADSFLRWYMGTSFSIHLVVVVLQTVLLLLAVRNEIRELVEEEWREREEDTGETPAGSPVSLPGFSMGTITQSVVRRLRRSSAISRLSGIALFAKAHYHDCTRYVVTHLVLLVVLVGLSVLPFTGKLYSLTLHYILPWMSSRTFLSFFLRPEPARRRVALFWCGRLCVTILLQRTVGDFLYRLVKDLLIAVASVGAVAVCVWAWPRRGFLARRVTTAIAESLHNTPIRAAPVPPQAPLLLSDTQGGDATDEAVVRRVALEEGQVGHVAMPREAPCTSSPAESVDSPSLSQPASPSAGWHPGGGGAVAERAAEEPYTGDSDSPADTGG